jgi:putative transposase
VLAEGDINARITLFSLPLSITMEASFCVAAIEEALARYGRPETFNTDQGSQFTCQAFTGVLAKHAIRISMDGKGAWRDNVFVERLWRTIKYEEVYLRAYDSVSDARQSIGRYLDLYNRRRPHSSLDGRTPDQAYFGHDTILPIRLAAWPTIHLSKRKFRPNNRGHLTVEGSMTTYSQADYEEIASAIRIADLKKITRHEKLFETAAPNEQAAAERDASA